MLQDLYVYSCCQKEHVLGEEILRHYCKVKISELTQSFVKYNNKKNWVSFTILWKLTALSNSHRIDQTHQVL